MLISKDLRLIFKNEIGGEIEISFLSPYTLQSVDEELQNTITTYKQNLVHGTKYVSNTLEDRYITISGTLECKKRAEIEKLVADLIRTFNTAIKGKLTAENINNKKSIEVYVKNIPEIKAENGLITYTINLVAQNPFWEDEVKTEYLALLTPELKFPLNIPKNKGIAFGRRRSIIVSKVENIGDVESGFKVIFKAKSGTVKNPQIYDVYSKKFIKINYQMNKGDILEVVNYPELKKIILNGVTNAFKYLDTESEFFNLKIGQNKIGYIADENTINLDIILKYSPRYLSV